VRGPRSYHDLVEFDAWLWWLIGAAGLGIGLVITAMPELGMLAVGALAAAVTAGVFGGDAVFQVAVFAVVSTALIAVIRPIAARHRAQRPQLATGVEALKGKQAIVLERVDGSGGRIKLAGEVWSARSLDTSHAYEVGQEVDVVDIEGATAIVM
jgi:membrane protein implicated in regulation of membrane protease activity